MKRRLKSFLKSFGVRLAIALSIFCLLYFFFIYAPLKRAKNDDTSSSQRQSLIELLNSYSLSRSEFLVYDPTNPAISSDIAGFIGSLQVFTTDLAAQQTYVDENFTEQAELFSDTITRTQVIWLETSGFYTFIEPILIYSPEEDLPNDGSVDNDQLIERAQASAAALEEFSNPNKTYQAGNQFQLIDGSTITHDAVRSFSLNEQTRTALLAASDCFESYTPSSSNQCIVEMTSVKKSILQEMNNVLQSETANVVAEQIKSIVDSLQKTEN